MKLPTVTVCFKDLTVGTTVYVGNRALPSTVNAYRNLFEDFLIRLGVMRGNKQPFTILDNISGTLKPVRHLTPSGIFMMLLRCAYACPEQTSLKAQQGQLHLLSW